MLNQIQGLKLQPLVWQLNRNFYTFILNKRTQQNSQLDESVQLVSATSSFRINSNNENQTQVFPIIVLLSNGTIFQLQKQPTTRNLILNQFYHFNNTNYKFNWQQVQIYHNNGISYLFYMMKIYKISFKIQNQNKKIYFLQQIQIQNIRKIVQQSIKLYFLNDKGCYIIDQNQKIIQILNFQTIQKQYNLTNLNIRDFTVFNNEIYLLDEKYGIFRFCKQNKLTLFKIQFPEKAKKIIFFDTTFLITYQILDYEYLGEYILNQTNKKLYLNKYYTQFQQIDQLIMFKRFALMSRGGQVNLFIHSIHRNLPYYYHKQTQMVSRHNYNQIVKIDYFNEKNLNSPSFMIVTPNGIIITQFSQIMNEQFLQKQVKITPQKPGKYLFDVIYTGTCKNQSTWKQSTYCSLTKRVQLNISDNLGQTLNQWWIWLCTSFAISIALLLIFCFVIKYFRKKNSQYKSFVQIRNRNSVSFMQMSNISQQNQ